jgi:hypothetical protein
VLVGWLGWVVCGGTDSKFGYLWARVVEIVSSTRRSVSVTRSTAGWRALS